MKNEQEQQEIRNNLKDFTGTENYYKIPLSKFNHTDGINHLIRICGCWWLISDTAIYLSSLKDFPDFLILTIKVNEDKSAIVTLKEDTDVKPIYTKIYGYTDFPLNEYEFYIINNVFLLRSEY